MTYVDRAELQRVLGKTVATPEELAAMDRVLEAAADEINWDLGYPAEIPDAVTSSAIVAEVNLERAAELWNFQYRTSGVLPQGPDMGVVVAPRDTWNRHHLRLNPLRARVGIA